MELICFKNRKSHSTRVQIHRKVNLEIKLQLLQARISQLAEASNEMGSDYFLFHPQIF